MFLGALTTPVTSLVIAHAVEFGSKRDLERGGPARAFERSNSQSLRLTQIEDQDDQETGDDGVGWNARVVPDRL
jgi:hypothetical protein